MAHHRSFYKQFFCQANSILPFEWMIWGKYNGIYDFFDKNRSKATYIRTLNSDNKHFVSDLPTLPKHRFFHLKTKFMCWIRDLSDFINFLPIFGSLRSNKFNLLFYFVDMHLLVAVRIFASVSYISGKAKTIFLKENWLLLKNHALR